MHVSTGKKNLFLRVALVALVVYIAASLIGLQLELNKGEKQLAELSKQEQSLTAQIDLLEGFDIDTSEYLEQLAREQGLSKPGESVFFVVPADE